MLLATKHENLSSQMATRTGTPSHIQFRNVFLPSIFCNAVLGNTLKYVGRAWINSTDEKYYPVFVTVYRAKDLPFIVGRSKLLSGEGATIRTNAYHLTAKGVPIESKQPFIVYLACDILSYNKIASFFAGLSLENLLEAVFSAVGEDKAE